MLKKGDVVHFSKEVRTWNIFRGFIYMFISSSIWFCHETCEGAEDLSNGFQALFLSYTLHTPCWELVCQERRGSRTSGRRPERLQSLEEQLGWARVGYCLLTAVGKPLFPGGLCLAPGWSDQRPSFPQAVFPAALSCILYFVELLCWCSPHTLQSDLAWRPMKNYVSNYWRCVCCLETSCVPKLVEAQQGKWCVNSCGWWRRESCDDFVLQSQEYVSAQLFSCYSGYKYISVYISAYIYACAYI